MGDFSRLYHSSKNTFAIVLSMMLFGTFSLPATAAPKTDIVIFKNGDRLTGEVKSLQRGRLSLNTDATGTISIEWEKISNVISNQYIQVELSSGTRFFGNLATTQETSHVLVNTAYGPQMLDNERVIIMSPIDTQSVVSALDIDLTIGYNFAKAGGVKQAMFGVDADYRTLKRIYSVSVSHTTNDSNDQETSTRSNFGVEYKRLWQNRWYVSGNLNLDQNDELGLNLRSSIGASGGRFFIQSNSMLLDLQAGLQFSRENLILDPVDVDSIEAMFAAQWDWFRFDAPELDWSTNFQVFPNLTDWGRVRMTFDTGLKWEVINDLKLGFEFYSTFDNQSQSDLGASSDYGVNTTVTYEF